MRHLTLTLHQPYALFVVLGLKQYETRSWKTNIRGPLRIHASKKPLTAEEFDKLRLFYLQQRYDLEYQFDYGQPMWELAHNPLLFGSVIGDVFIEGCYSTNITEMVDRLSPLERSMGDYSPNRYFMPITRHNFYINPTPARGLQRFWYWDDTGADCRAREKILWET